MPLLPGKYTATLLDADRDNLGVWYQFSVINQQTGITYSSGSIRFPKADISPGAGSWTELYLTDRQKRFVSSVVIPETTFKVTSVSANDCRIKPLKCVTAYQLLQCSNAVVTNGELSIRVGQNVARINPPAAYVI